MKSFVRIRILFSVVFLLVSLIASSQIKNPVKWSYEIKQVADNKAQIIIKAKIDENWSLYSQNVPQGGPLPTLIKFDIGKNLKLVGKPVENPKPKVKFDEVFEMNIGVFQKNASFIQDVEVLNFSKFQIPVDIDYMVCDKVSCIPLNESFVIDFDGTKYKNVTAETVQTDVKETQNDTSAATVDVKQNNLPPANEIKMAEKTPEEPKKSAWYVFWIGLIGGLLALLTPCVWPVIPMTVSFFLNRAGSRKSAIRDAIFYGISIIVIYVILGLGVALIFGAEKLNQIATSPAFNLFFFALIVVFAFAFFGAFELTLPSKWVNAINEKSEKKQGFLGIFFMGLTLVLVSFSCTGPIVGALLVEAASSANFLSPLLGMLGFSMAIAIPFSLLAIFPSWLKSMPKSGGWMNSVKVVLAFLMLAFSLKFFVTADSVAGWNILTRDAFIAIWIVIFTLLGFYLLGKIKMYHDSDLKHVNIWRLMLAIASFSFALWMLPGLWGAKLEAISAFAPSITTQSFDLSKKTQVTATSNNLKLYEGYDIEEGIYGLIYFKKYEQGVDFAKKHNKPILLYFSGYGCANCKKMDASVWSNEEVQRLIAENYVLIKLYTDDRTELPENEQYVSSSSGKERKIKTVGQKWSDLQASKFKINAQPYYILLDPNEQPLTEPAHFNPNVTEYIAFLKKGLENFKNRQ